MNLYTILLASIVKNYSAVPNVPPAPVEESVEEAEEAAVPKTPKEKNLERLSLGLKYGRDWQNSTSYDDRRAALAIDEYLIEMQFRKEGGERISREEQEFTVSGLTIKGKQRSQLFQVNVIFGYALYQNRNSWMEFKVYGQVLGGLQLEKRLLILEGDDLPIDQDLNFLLGGGGRTELAHRISKWTSWPFLRSLELGVGATVDYLGEQGDIKEPQSKVYYGGYLLARIAKKR